MVKKITCVSIIYALLLSLLLQMICCGSGAKKNTEYPYVPSKKIVTTVQKFYFSQSEAQFNPDASYDDYKVLSFGNYDGYLVLLVGTGTTGGIFQQTLVTMMGFQFFMLSYDMVLYKDGIVYDIISACRNGVISYADIQTLFERYSKWEEASGWYDMQKYPAITDHYPERFTNRNNVLKAIYSQNALNEAAKLSEDDDPDLPLIYRQIKKLGVSKEDFISANRIAMNSVIKQESVHQIFFTEEEIEILFDENAQELIKTRLATPSSFYYNGELYLISELAKLDKRILSEMAVDGGLMNYFSDLEKLIRDCNMRPDLSISITERIEEIKRVLESNVAE